MKQVRCLENEPPVGRPPQVRREAAGVFLLFFTVSALFSQNKPAEEGYALRFEIEVEAKIFTTDKLQNIYLIDSQDDIVKLTPTGQEQFRYVNTTLGEPSYLDATNPFNLLLFFPDFQAVVTLDRTLNLAGQLNLFQLGLVQVNAIGMAGDGNLWLFDEANFRLKKIGNDGTLLLQGTDLSLELRQTVRPNFLLERGQQVYLNDPALGILVFDVFGRYSKTLPLLGLSSFQVIGEELIFLENGQLQSFHLQALLRSPLRLPLGASVEKKVRVEKDLLYILEPHRLKVYRF